MTQALLLLTVVARHVNLRLSVVSPISRHKFVGVILSEVGAPQSARQRSRRTPIAQFPAEMMQGILPIFPGRVP